MKPERTRLKPGTTEFALRKPLPQKWWVYADKRPELYATIADARQVVVTAAVSATTAFAFADTGTVFAHKLNVFNLRTHADLAILQSTHHRDWAHSYSSTLGGIGNLNYSPTDCFETFPVPPSIAGLADIGERYDAHRRAVMLARQEGLTKTYNRFHDPDETAADIQTLRELHVEMDQAVAAAYGWTDLALDHDFGVTKQGLRFTISELARREVLARLLRLNHERYAEEVRQGLHEKKKPTRGRAKATAPADDGTLC